MKRLGKWKAAFLGGANALIYAALIGIAPPAYGQSGGDGDGDGTKYYQRCGCIRTAVVDGQTVCAEWGRDGCPRGTVQTCGVECAGGGDGDGDGDGDPPVE